MLGLHNITNEVNNFTLSGKKKEDGETIFHSPLPKPWMELICTERGGSRIPLLPLLI